MLAIVCAWGRRWVPVPRPGWGALWEQGRLQVAAGKRDLLPNSISILLKSFFPVNCFVASYDETVMIPGSNERKYSLAHGQGSSSPERGRFPKGNT